jgi:hypothetical protein
MPVALLSDGAGRGGLRPGSKGLSTQWPSGPCPDDNQAIWSALVLGVRDYAHKCGFRKAVVGLSGGIDSALVMAIATAALGRDNVLGVLMPSPYSSDHSVTDALSLCKNLNIPHETLPIGPLMQGYDADPGRCVCRQAPRHHRRKYSVAHSGQPADGPLQQVWLSAALHRQQVRNGGGLLHPLWRHERRAGGDCRCPQNPSFRLCQWLNQQAIQAWGDPPKLPPSTLLVPEQSDPSLPRAKLFPSTSSTNPPVPNSNPARSIRIPCPPTRCWMTFWNAWCSGRSPWPTWLPLATTGRLSKRW